MEHEKIKSMVKEINDLYETIEGDTTENRVLVVGAEIARNLSRIADVLEKQNKPAEGVPNCFGQYLPNNMMCDNCDNSPECEKETKS